jgi:hypothetical protein
LRKILKRLNARWRPDELAVGARTLTSSRRSTESFISMTKPNGSAPAKIVVPSPARRRRRVNRKTRSIIENADHFLPNMSSCRGRAAMRHNAAAMAIFLLRKGLPML